MKIAVASSGLEVSPHLESSTNYNCFTIAQGMIMDYRNLPLLDHQALATIDLLSELKFDTLIVGCVKSTNRAYIDSKGIEVVCSAQGDAKTVVENYLSEEFIEDDSFCAHYKSVYGEEGNCKKSLVDIS